MAAVGAASLLAASLGLTGWAAITLPPITAATDPEHRVAIAAAANSLTENNLAMTRLTVKRDQVDSSPLPYPITCNR
jgi:hypothetical protein